jgi:predicted phage-related endonuclease
VTIERRKITNRDLWLEWRRANLNASEIAACFGLHPFMTLAQLVAAKRGMEGLGPDPESALIRRGNALEDDARDEVEKLHPQWDIVKNNDYFVDIDHRLGATPDFLCVDRNRERFGVLQTKVVASPIFKREWQHDTPPYYAILQTAQEMMLSNAAWGAIAPLVVGDFSFEVPQVYLIERHEGAEARIIDTAREFWRAFNAGEQPTIDYGRDEKLIQLMFPTAIAGAVVDLSTDNRVRELLEMRELLRATRNDVDKRLETIETEIKAKIADAEIAIVDGWKVSLKQQTRKAHWTKETSFRVLRASRIVAKEGINADT